MKHIKYIIVIILAAFMLVSMLGCADSKEINGKTYRPYGLINETECRNDSIHYEVAIDATISGILFSEIFLIPTFYVFGYHLYEPTMTNRQYHNRINSANKGVIN